MKIATWNVNGIRARQAQLQEFVERERPDVLCLQEIKASPDQIPAALCEMEGYWCYWHGDEGLFGRRAACEPGTRRSDPRFSHPAFDHETRIVAVRLRATVVVDVRAQRRQGFSRQDALSRGARRSWRSSPRAASARALRRSQRRAHRMDVHPKERKPLDRPAARRSARSVRADHRPRRPRRPRPRAGARRRPTVHLVGAVAEHAPAQHRLAARLRARERRAGARARAALSSASSARAITGRWSRSSGNQL